MESTTNEDSIIAVRVKAALRNAIVALSEKHEVSASDIVRQALKLGLKKFDREAFRPVAK